MLGTPHASSAIQPGLNSAPESLSAALIHTVLSLWRDLHLFAKSEVLFLTYVVRIGGLEELFEMLKMDTSGRPRGDSPKDCSCHM